jgi:UDP:flavonoid glycosyltransferase YjiC (YdhE family)
VLYADYVPLELLLDRCSAIVHHGGRGTAAQALLSGTPQLLYPRLDEQRENARQLKRLGVCEVLQVEGLSGEKLADDLRKLTSDSGILAKCRDIARKDMIMPEERLEEYLRASLHAKNNGPAKCS